VVQTPGILNFRRELAQALNLKKSLSYNLKFLSKLSDRHFLLRITVGVAGTMFAHHLEILPFGDIAREQPDRSAHWAARTDHRELRGFVDLNRKAELAP
jgi:hypothetical protein